MLKVIRGKGAFRRFKNYIEQYEIEQDWYNYKERRLEQMARNWCGDNDIPMND